MNRIIEKQPIAESICRFVIEAPQIARKRKESISLLRLTAACYSYSA